MTALLKEKSFQRLTLLFVISSVVVFIMRNWLRNQDVDYQMVLVGNFIIYGASLMAVILFTRSGSAKTGAGITRLVYAGFMTKFFILVSVAMMYFYFSDEINVKGVFICLALYLVYNFMGAGTAAREQKTAHKKHHKAH